MNCLFWRQLPSRRVYAPLSRRTNPFLHIPQSALFLHYIALFQSRQRPVFKEIVASYRTQALILQVCCCWRNTALPDPRLWTTIPLLGSGEGSDDEEDVYGKEEKSFAHPMITGSTQERASYWKALEKTLNQTSYLPLQLLFHFNADGNIGNHDDTIFSLQTFVSLLPQANTISLYIYCRKRHSRVQLGHECCQISPSRSSSYRPRYCL